MSAISVSSSRAQTVLRALLIVALAVAVLLTGLPSATAQVGHTYRFFANTFSAGTLLQFEDGTSTTPRRYTVNAWGTGSSGFAGYSVDRDGTHPTGTTTYQEFDWDDDLAGLVDGSRGPVEWIVKNGWGAAGLTENVLAGRVRDAGYDMPTGYPPISTLIGGTQAAIWHYTNGVELNAAQYTSTDGRRVLALYRYLVDQAADRAPTSPSAPTLDLTSADDRVAFVVEPGDQFGPFTIESSTAATVSLSGSPAQVVDVAGQTLSGALAPGTTFWIRPSGSTPLDGAVTISATGQSVSGQVLNVALGTAGTAFNPGTINRTPVGKLTNVGFAAATDSLPVSWEIDHRGSDHHDPEAGATTRTYDTRNPPPIASPLTQDLHWSDGTTTVNDLVRFSGRDGAGSPNAYSVDFYGTSPGYNHLYAEADWSAGRNDGAHDLEGEVLWILQHSYPEVSAATLTGNVRAAGYATGSTGNITNWNALAGAQAAIWHLTDGRDLDTTFYQEPSAVTASGGTDDPSAVLNDDAADGWIADAPGEAILTFTFPERLELRDYTVTTREGSAQGATPLGWKLQRQGSEGVWNDVSSTAVSDDPDRFPGGTATSHTTVLGASATYGGYAHYRLVVSGASDPATPVEIGQVSFSGFGVFGSQPNLQLRRAANDTEVIAVYDYLIAQARQHGPALVPADPVATFTDPAGASAVSGTAYGRAHDTALLGPFTYDGDTSVILTLSGASDDARLLEASTGTPETELRLSAGDAFWIYPGTGEEGQLTVNATGSWVNRIAARALNSSSQPDSLETFGTIGVSSARAELSLLVPFTTDAVAIGLSVVSGRAGDQVEVTGSAFRPGESVELRWGADQLVLGTTVAGDDGRLVSTITIPTDAGTGLWALTAAGGESLRVATAEFTVLAASTDTGGPGPVVGESGSDPVREDDRVDVDPGAGQAGDNAADELSDTGAGPISGDLAVLAWLLLALGGLLLVARRSRPQPR